MKLLHRYSSKLWVIAVLVLCTPMVGCNSALNREQEASLGEQVQPQFIAESGGEVPDSEVTGYVDRVGRSLLAHVKDDGARELPWEFHTLDSSVVNAFALPGGKVFITRGLMTRMDNEAQMAGVIGHEIGHVVAQHIGKQMAHQRNVNILVGVAGAAADSSWVGILGGGAGKMYLLKFGRGQELEADRYGMEYMAAAGYDPAQIRRVMEILQEAGGGRGFEMVSTHPHPETRIDQSEELMSSEYAHTRNDAGYVVNREQYQAILERMNQLPPPKHGEE